MDSKEFPFQLAYIRVKFVLELNLNFSVTAHMLVKSNNEGKILTIRRPAYSKN